MEELPETRIVVGPELSADQLFDFYQRNDICEVGYGKETATRILHHPHVMVGAFAGQHLVALARATFDGLGADIVELSVDLRWQGSTRHETGALVESDPYGLGAAVAGRLLEELERLGVSFISACVVEGVEEEFYKSIGLVENVGHRVYCRDRRPYVVRDNGGEHESG